jgi:gliding motility-associated-like protein
VVINQPLVNWLTAPGALDANLSCDDPAGLAAAQTLVPEPDKCSFTLIKTSGPLVQGSCPGTGTYTNTWNFTDACGVTIADYVQTITIVDNTPPTASNPAPINVSCITQVPGPDVTVVTDEADNCSAPVVAFVSDVSDNLSCPETITRTYSVSDACGNSINVTQSIVILDDIFPTASNPAAINVQCIDDVPLPNINVITDAADNCGTPVVAFVSDVSNNLSCPETIIRTYSVADACNNTIMVTQTIVVLDDIAPTASNPAPMILACGEALPPPDIAVVTDATDNCAAPTVAFVSDVSNGQSCPETITRTYSITDICGNFTLVTQEIVLPDSEAPTAGNLPTINVQCLEDVPSPDVTIVTDATDNCSDVGIEFISDELAGQGCPLTIARTYRVTDACGNFTDLVQTIIVNDDTPPELITVMEPVIRVMCGAVPEIPDLEFIDNCSTDLIIDYTEDISVYDDNTYTIFRFWAVADACNNQNVFTQTVEMRTAGESTSEALVLCVTDDPVDLELFITNTVQAGGEWESETLDLLDGSIFDPSEAGTGNFEFIYSYNENNCSWRTIITITVNRSCVSDSCIASSDDVTISKLVTPNNDGYNDFFEVSYEVTQERAMQCDITVDVEFYNRWGKRVFRGENYQNDWGGTSPSGSVGASGILPSGTYYYIVTLNESGINPIKGFILLGTE